MKTLKKIYYSGMCTAYCTLLAGLIFVNKPLLLGGVVACVAGLLTLCLYVIWAK